VLVDGDSETAGASALESPLAQAESRSDVTKAVNTDALFKFNMF
jgi:hypothetical protein